MTITTPVPPGTKFGSIPYGDGEHVPVNLLVDSDGNDPFAAVVSGLASVADTLTDVVAALQGTLAVALPAGASTEEKQDDTIASIEASALLEVPFPITPHATNALTRPTKAIAIVTGGTVVFRPVGSLTDVTVTLPPGLFPLPATHIRATSSAAGLTGF